MDFSLRILLCIIVSFGISALLGPILIPVLHRLKFGQEIRDEGPSWHKKKTGTPTMGGIIFIAATAVTTLIFTRDIKVLYLLICSLLFGVIGFIDDFIKVILKRNLGLTASQKFILQVLVSTVYSVVIYKMGFVDFNIIVPFLKIELPLWYFFVPISVFIMTGFVNAVNLTDGLDGLATTVTVVVSAFFAFSAYIFDNFEITIYMTAIIGALLGFLLYNRHPAKVFMGDTGSLFLGGAISAVAVMLKMPIILIIAGFVYAFEALSVMIQVAYFKRTKKRVFKMTPIHHHFEMCGYSEVKIVVLFSSVTLICCIIAALGLIFRF